MSRLTDKQIQTAGDAWKNRYGYDPSSHKEGRELIDSLAALLQYEPAPLDGVLVEKMVKVYYNENSTGNIAMTAALRVAADALLGPTTDAEIAYGWKTTNDLLAKRRAKLEKPVDPRVIIVGNILATHRSQIDNGRIDADAMIVEILAALDEVK